MGRVGRSRKLGCLVVPVCANPVIVRVREKVAGVFFIGFGITLAFSN